MNAANEKRLLITEYIALNHFSLINQPEAQERRAEIEAELERRWPGRWPRVEEGGLLRSDFRKSELAAFDAWRAAHPLPGDGA
jgi:hypothetical protein